MVFGENALKDVYRRLVWGPWRRMLEAAPAGFELRANASLGRLMSHLSPRSDLSERLTEAGATDRRAVREIYETHFMNQYVGFSFAKITATSWPDYLELRGREHLDAALEHGGVILAHPHMGLPQLPLHVLGLLGYAAHQVGGGRTNVALSATGQRVADLRASLEHRICARLHDGSAYLRPVLRALRSGEIVFTACDGTGGGEELGRRQPVPVLGRTMAMPVFPAWLAAQTGASLLTLTTWRSSGTRFTSEIGPKRAVPSVEAATESLGVWLTAAIREHPGDWHFWDAWHAGDGGLLVPASSGGYAPGAE